MPSIPIRIAAVLFWFNGVGFGVFVLPAIRNLILHRELPLVFGFRAYGGGFFERHGLETTIPLLIAFLLLNVGEVVAGVLLWGGARSGAILAFRAADGDRELDPRSDRLEPSALT